MLASTQGTVLYIDDDHLNLRLVHKSLKKMGYDFHEAIDARTGIDLAYEIQPNVILLDLNMPGIDGFEATKIIKADDRLKHIPIVILTADNRDEIRRESMAHGVDAHLTKPISRTMLLKVVGQMIKSHQSIM